MHTPNPPRHRRTRKLPGALTALAAATLIAASPQTVQASPDGGTEFVPTPAETPSERIAAEEEALKDKLANAQIPPGPLSFGAEPLAAAQDRKSVV